MFLISTGERMMLISISEMVYTPPRDSVSIFCLGEEEMTISITGSRNTCEILF